MTYNIFHSDYYNIMNTIFNELHTNNRSNANLLFIIENEFHILEQFSHIIKKNNIKINIVINDLIICEKMINNIKGEECENYVNIYSKIEDTIDQKIDIAVIFHLESIEKIESILYFFNHILINNSLIYIYSSLCKQKNKIYYKNMIREKIILYSKNNMGYVLHYDTIINKINQEEMYDICNIKIYKKNNYIVYGDNIVYEIILKRL